MSGEQVHGDRILDQLGKAFQYASQYGDDASKDPKKYKDLAKKLCTMEHSYFLERDRIKEAARQPTVDAFNEMLEENDNAGQSFNAKHSKRYTDFAKEITRFVQSHSDEGTSSQMIDEDVQMDDRIVDIDPITKLPLENPVKNKNCNHIYGKDSVVQSLQRNPRLRCPIIGCPNKQFIKLGDLIEDEELVIRLERQRLRDK